MTSQNFRELMQGSIGVELKGRYACLVCGALVWDAAAFWKGYDSEVRPSRQAARPADIAILDDDSNLWQPAGVYFTLCDRCLDRSKASSLDRDEWIKALVMRFDQILEALRGARGKQD